MSSLLDSQCIIRPIFQLGYLPAERAFERETTLRDRVWPGAGKRMPLIPERFIEVSRQQLRNGAMDRVSVVGSSNVLICPLCAPIEDIGKLDFNIV